MKQVELTHTQAPPSSNTNTGVGGRGDPRAIARRKGEWEGTFAMLLMVAKVPRNLTRVRAFPRLKFRTKTVRDADNFYFPISKPLGDALKKGGWLPDDGPEFFQCERVEIVVGATDLPKHMKSSMSIRLEYE